MNLGKTRIKADALRVVPKVQSTHADGLEEITAVEKKTDEYIQCMF